MKDFWQRFNVSDISREKPATNHQELGRSVPIHNTLFHAHQLDFLLSTGADRQSPAPLCYGQAKSHSSPCAILDLALELKPGLGSSLSWLLESQIKQTSKYLLILHRFPKLQNVFCKAKLFNLNVISE